MLSKYPCGAQLVRHVLYFFTKFSLNQLFHRPSQLIMIHRPNQRWLTLTALLMVYSITIPGFAYSWTPAEIISPALGSSFSPAIAQNNKGRTVVVWHYGTNIEAAIKDSGGTWGPPTVVASFTDATVPPSLAPAPDGTIMAIWSGSSAGLYNVQVAALKPGETVWSLPVVISSTRSSHPYQPQLKFDSKGNAIAVWGVYKGVDLSNVTYAIVESAQYKTGLGWTAPVTLSPGAGFHFYPVLAVNSAGNAIAVWNDALVGYGLGRSYTLQSVRKPANGAWRKPTVIAYYPGGGVGGQRVVLDNFNRATVVWHQRVNINDFGVFAAESSVPGNWSLAQALSSKTITIQSSYNPELAIDRAGNVTAVWTWLKGDGTGAELGNGVKARLKPISTLIWSGARELTSKQIFIGPVKLSASPDGSLVTVGWGSYAGPLVTVYQPTLGWDLGWRKPVQLVSPVTYRADTLEVNAFNKASSTIAWSGYDWDRHPNQLINVSTLLP